MMKKTPPIIAPSSIRALALDLDGTTLRPGSILAEHTIAVLRALIERNIAVIIATGRSPQSSEPFREAIGTKGPMVYYNGAEVILMPDFTILRSIAMKLDIIKYCVDLARDLDIYIHVFVLRDNGTRRETLLAEGGRLEAELYTKRTGLSVGFGDLRAALEDPDITGCIKAMFIADDDELDIVRKKLSLNFPDRVYMTASFPRFLEIMAGGVSKGTGLEAALKHLEIAPAQVIAFGDADNDLPLFAASGFSAAPANAKESVLEAADLIIGSNSEDGVAVFLEELFSL